jgi:hypothetical protein
MSDANWGKPLTAVGRFDETQLRRLQAVGVFAVEDLVAVAESDPEALRNLMGDIDLSDLSLGGIRRPRRQSRQAAFLRTPRTPGLHYFGASRPTDIEIADMVPAEQIEETIGSLAAGPTDVPSEAPPVPDVNLARTMRPIRDQGERYTCVAHASVAVLEHRKSALDGLTIDLSPQFLYWAAKQRDGSPNEPGTFIKTAAQAMIDVGVCADHVWPYLPNPSDDNESYAPPPANAETSAIEHTAETHITVARQSSSALKSQLDQGRTVAFSLAVYSSDPTVRVWTNPYGKIPMPFPDTRFRGIHAMCAVGYVLDSSSPGGGHFIVRNSWGTTWAPQSPYGAGYGTVPFAYVDNHCVEAGTVE